MSVDMLSDNALLAAASAACVEVGLSPRWCEELTPVLARIIRERAIRLAGYPIECDNCGADTFGCTACGSGVES